MIRPPYGKNVKIIWKNFWEKAFYEKRGTLVEKSKIIWKNFLERDNKKNKVSL